MYAAEPVHPLTSVAVIVNEYGPGVVGVPVRLPELDSESGGGSDPDVTWKVYGPVPPLAMKFWL